MQVIDSIPALRQARAALRGSVGLVTTMGALHSGHLALAESARADNDHVMATIFVNPTQFGPNEDFTGYPRDLAHDLALFEAAGVDLVFTPTPDVIYPSGFQTTVTVKAVSQGLEGARRPGHFDGVATVVAKLFNLAQADRAYFGQKDAQQVVVIRRMARDLDFPLEIIVCPTVREADGLARSSRNVYLSPDQRLAAAVLSRALKAAGAAYDAGERSPTCLRERALSVVRAEPLAAVEYVSVADPRALTELDAPTETPLLLSLTVAFGRTRLLDNCLLPLALNDRAGLTAVLGAPPGL